MRTMTATKNKLLADRVWEEVWHQGNLERIEELFAPDFVRHDPGREIQGPEENRQVIKGFRAAFPDLHFRVLDQIAEGGKVALHYTFHPPHLRSFTSLPPPLTKLPS